MARKLTYRHPQPRVSWLTLPELRPATWAALELALGSGRKLTDKERERVVRVVESAQFWRRKALQSFSGESVRATLAAIAKMSDAHAACAAEDCDVTTESFLRDGRFLYSAATIQAQAAAALANFPTLRRGPRGAWRPMLADNVLHLWRELGGADCSASVNPGVDYATALVRFGVALFAEVQPIGASAVAKLLTDARKREGTNIG